jgi:hypothetical protein
VTFNTKEMAEQILGQLECVPPFTAIDESKRAFLVEFLARLIRQYAGDVLTRTKDDEPIFVLCARDLFAPRAVRFWSDLIRGQPTPDEAKIAGALDCAAAMDAWPGAKKLPGTTQSQKTFKE